MEFGLFEIILFGGLFFVGCLLSAFERYALTVIGVAAVLAGGWFFFGHPVREFVTTIGWHDILLKQLPLYLGAGLAVALGKWFILVLKTASRIKDAKESFDETKYSIKDGYFKGNPEIERRIKFIEHWNRTVSRSYVDSPYDSISVDGVLSAQWKDPEVITNLLTPKAKKHIDDIAYWIFFWPFVVVSTLFKDLFFKIAKHTARIFDWAFNRVSRLVISNAAKGI